MTIDNYIDKLEGEGKRHVLLIVTPKDKYPDQFFDNRFYNLEQAVLKNSNSYTNIYEENQNEIMQYVALRLFLRPVICDKYSVRNRTITKIKRLSEREIISFFVAKHFYETVLFGEKNEEEAINDGKIQAKEFLEKYPLDNFEFASVRLTKDSDKANVLIKLDFENKNKNYYFDYVYVH